MDLRRCMHEPECIRTLHVRQVLRAHSLKESEVCLTLLCGKCGTAHTITLEVLARSQCFLFYSDHTEKAAFGRSP